MYIAQREELKRWRETKPPVFGDYSTPAHYVSWSRKRIARGEEKLISSDGVWGLQYRPTAPDRVVYSQSFLGRIMKLTKANVAGLISSQQQSEMKSILAGTWPALKPLPVFKYQTAEYRASIDFDKKRGEWVCRKTSVSSNKVEELRGELSAITMALPLGEALLFIDGAEEQEQEQELAKDANRRLQALQEWKEKYKSGARYFELREYLSESLRAEIEDSLRLSLTARQLQFNPKNVAHVFDDLSIAGGRFAALIEFATRQKAKQEALPQALLEGAAPESAGDNPVGPHLEAGEGCADEVPAVSIRNVLPEGDHAPLAEQDVHSAPQQVGIALPEIAVADSPSLIEDPHQEGNESPAFTAFAAQARTTQSPTNHIEGSPSRFPVFEMSALQVAAFALLSLAAIAFSVGLAVGRGPLGRRVPETPKSVVAVGAQSPTLRDQAAQSAPRVATQPVIGSDNSAGASGLGDATPLQDKPGESKGNSEYPTEAKVPSADSDSIPTTTFQPPPTPEIHSEHGGTSRLTAPHAPPPASYKRAPTRTAAARKNRALPSPAPYAPTSATRAAAHLPGPSTILVSVPHRGSQAFKVTFPEKTIAATSSFAMSSQLSVVVPPEPGVAVADKSARLEAGELVFFDWPHYPGAGSRYGLAEIIRVRATIGELGQVREVKFLDGSASLLPATVQAIRQWRYKPTLLDKRPVQAQQDITIDFRPPQYSSRVSTKLSSR